MLTQAQLLEVEADGAISQKAIIFIPAAMRT
jgi:hypothetical protein